MDETLIRHEQPTGDTCSGCECDLVLVTTAGEPELYIECDCGVVACIGPRDARPRLSPAA